jgi:hypothetical protein
MIVASLHAQAGKTLLARAMTEYFVLSGKHPVIFDTDFSERRLCACFPYDAIVVDLNNVRGQMALFDTLAKPFDETRVVDVTPRSFRRFFNLMRDTDFVAEARANRVEPVILYIVDRNPESFEEGWELRERFPDCTFVVVGNAFARPPRDSTRRTPGYRALDAHDLHMVMPALDAAFAGVIEDPGLSLSDLIRQPLSLGRSPRARGDISFEAHAAVRAWLVRMFQEFHWVTQQVERRGLAYPAPVGLARQAMRSGRDAPN